MSNPLNDLDPTGRFSNRAGNYAKYRPSYPPPLIAFLEEQLDLRKGRQIADIGSGTGIFTELLLLKGAAVTGLEPNAAMRQAAEERLAAYERFYSLEGRAEQTGLADHSIDLITVAQAFHWMEPQPAKKEFIRILKPGGHIALIWNLRLQHTPFLRAYEELVREFAKGYDAANRIEEPVLKEFFHPLMMEIRVFENIRLLDFAELKGLSLSASYMPTETDPHYGEMEQRLEEVFAIHHENGLVRMEYETKLYYNLPGILR
jgi:ubiquinone/menaquinone biosynthesis C-methylase UbiE